MTLKRPDQLGTPEVVCNECGKQAPGARWGEECKCPHCGAVHQQLKEMREFLRERGF